MKKTFLTLLIAAAGATGAFGQAVLVAGWDFDLGDATYTTLGGVLAANYSDVVSDGPASAVMGTLYLNGDNGSDLWKPNNPNAQVSKIQSWADTPQQILTRDSVATKLGEFDGVLAGEYSMGLNRTSATVSDLSFVINTAGLASLGDVTYRTRMQTAGLEATIDWSLVVGAQTYVLGGPIGSSGELFQTRSFDLSLIDLAGASSVSLVGMVANPSTSNVMLVDNFAVYGVIPEPSTYAALLGLATLGICVIRRRRAATRLEAKA